MLATPLIATNLISTGLIAARIWYYRRHIKKSLGRQNKGRVEKILLLLVESGIVYLGLWILLYAKFVPSRGSSMYTHLYSDDIWYGVMISTFHNIAAIYPTFVFLVVAAERSTAEAMIGSAQLSRSIRFASFGDARSDAGDSLTTFNSSEDISLN